MKRDTRILTAAVGLLLVSGLVTGCGGNDEASSRYCRTLRADAPVLRAFTAKSADSDFRKFPGFSEQAHVLARQAPTKIRPAWSDVTFALDRLADVLEAAGLSYADFENILSSGRMADGVDRAKLKKVNAAVQLLSSAKVAVATTAIDRDAVGSCKVDLTKKG